MSMLSLRRPSPIEIDAFLGAQRAHSFSYAEVGATQEAQEPIGYVHDHNRQLLGHGPEAFARACAALRGWQMFPPSLATIEPAGVPLAAGNLVAIVVKAAGVWWKSAARIVYVIAEERRFGFAYGTLPMHAESGEERFLVEWLPDDSVWYDLRAFSRPQHWLAKVGKPFARRVQKRFGPLSKASMLAATAR